MYTSQGVSPVNHQIGADAAIDLNEAREISGEERQKYSPLYNGWIFHSEPSS